MMKRFIKFLKTKWIDAECRNLCKFCKYNHMCDLYINFRLTGKNNRGN